MNRGFFMMILVCYSLSIVAQKSEQVADYINTYKQLAVEEMIRTGVPASIKLAQGIHETEAGRSDLVLRSNNHFGIKCKTGWDGKKVYHDDDARGECFRSYNSSSDSYTDHSNFLKGSQRYSFLFQLDPADYKAWAYGLKKAGYATNTKYSQILIKLIEEYNLQQYSLIALGRLSAEDEQMTGVKIPPVESRKDEGLLTSGPAVMEEPPAITISYPSGEFVINKTRVLFARAGTSLLALAQQYDISLSRLLDFNDLEQEDVLVHDQLIFLQRKRKTGSVEFHVVQTGESLYGISQSEGIRLASLLQYNLLKPYMRAAPGEKLYLQKEVSSQPRLVSEDKMAEKTIIAAEAQTNQNLQSNGPLFPVMHVVQPKETLYGIAKSYSTTANKIIEWNKLKNVQLKSGQELVIYKN